MDVIAWRRQLHQRPELGFLEYRTASVVAEHLEGLGFDVRVGERVLDREARLGVPEDTESEWRAAVEEGYSRAALDHMRGGMTGVVARLDGNRPGPTTAIRADLDALPIREAATDHLPSAAGFVSERPGVMHACGHDGHVAIGLELAHRLASRDFPGSVRLIFQPAEEGLRGARAMAIPENLDGVDDLYTFHLGMGAPSGAVFGGVHGSLASTKLRATFRGRAAHAGLAPETGRNALLAAAHATLAVHALVQHGTADTRVNVGSFVAPGTTNVIAPLAELRLEVRASETAACEDLEARTRAALDAAAAMFGVSCEVETTGKAPSVVCDPELVRHVAEVATGVPGVDRADALLHDGGSDDASWLIDAVRDAGGRGTYLVVGSDLPSGHHSDRFDLDERSLTIAVDLLERLVRDPASRGRSPLR
ncbi:amidohydrolase [Nocardioides marmoriginsengisoli]|uniref:Amidohydrolase n=1 Tax=Nocardioides marmoriginsengisoli TaxID=661483 RepID=A0A3N0CEN7_9ACTN|nr:amidohydrolase [Nocardioides marmoriginsengisoli]RNL61912.1 amidohydrolase [Nocardioides marmoriginsengisoli]